MKRGAIIEDAVIRINGSDEPAGIATITLPDVEHKTEAVSGLGVNEHDVVIPTSFNSMKMSLKFSNRAKDISFGQGGNVNFTAVAAILVENSETHENELQKAIYSFKGKRVKTSGGDLGKATKNETELEFALTYFKEEIDGLIVNEIDVYNKKVTINGIDIYQRVKNILA